MATPGKRTVHTVAQDLSLALDTIAREAIARAVENISWEDWPDVGEHDWTAIVARAESLVPRQRPAQVQAAEALLERRARLWAAQEHGTPAGPRRRQRRPAAGRNRAGGAAPGYAAPAPPGAAGGRSG